MPWLSHWQERLLDLLIVVFLVTPVALFLLRRNGVHLTASRLRTVMYAFTLWHLASWLLLALLAAVRGTVNLWRRRYPDVVASADRRALLGAGMALAATSALGGAGLLIKRTREPRVEELVIPVPGLMPSLDGFTLVQVSDLHVGIFLFQRELERVFDQVNDLAPDIAVMTGDLVDNSPAFIRPFARATERLRPRQLSLAVLGNHDFYTGGRDVAASLEKRGVRVLRNQHVLIGPDRRVIEGRSPVGALVIGGIDDPAGRYYDDGVGADLTRAFDGSPYRVPRVLLSHRPDYFPVARQHGVVLTLSGHTHGGQLVVPLLGSAARVITPFPAGYYRDGASHLYVNRGLGVVGLPVRLNCPAEVTRLVLRTA